VLALADEVSSEWNDVGFWPKADIEIVPRNVRFSGNCSSTSIYEYTP
jgi:hypothetical protein